jgi:hypothetical protein
MSFDDLIDDVAAQKKCVVVYADDDTGADLEDRLATRNLRVDHRHLPDLNADAFVVIRDGEEFCGALTLVDLLEFLRPPIPRPREREGLSPGYRAIYELLDDTVFVSLDRRQLLATSRELEDRAWRTAHGRMHVGFQRADAYEAQTEVYRDLATGTAIDIHVYLPAAAAGSLRAVDGVTVHTEPEYLIDNYWFILYDDGGDGTQNCALVAKAHGGRRYRGFWTYDPELVGRGFEAIGCPAQS